MSKATRELIREILDLPDAERIQVFASLRDDLDAQGKLLEDHQTDELNQRMKDALEAFAAVRKYLGLSDDEARQLTMAKYDKAQAELNLEFNASRVVRPFNNSWDLVKQASLGGRLPVSQTEKWRRKSVSNRLRLNQRHSVGLRKWLDSNPKQKTPNAYDYWRRKFNKDNKGVEALLSGSAAILSATTKTWDQLLQEVQHGAPDPDIERVEMADAADLSKPRVFPLLLKISETAELLNVEVEEVLRWIEDERIPFVELPSDGEPVFRVPRAALVASLGGKYQLYTEIGRVRPEKLLYDEALISQRLIEARHSFGWSQSDLAKVSGLSRPMIGKIESKDIRQMSIGTIVRLAMAFDVSTDYFLSPYERLPRSEKQG